MKKKYIYIIIFSIITCLIATFFSIDYFISKQYSYEVTMRESDKTVICDGKSAIKVKVKLVKDGKGVPDHTIFVFASKGSLPSNRLVTNEDGYILFYYYPYLFVNENVTPLEKVTITMKDESNSIIFMIPATDSFELDVSKPEQTDEIKDWQNIKEGGK